MVLIQDKLGKIEVFYCFIANDATQKQTDFSITDILCLIQIMR